MTHQIDKRQEDVQELLLFSRIAPQESTNCKSDNDDSASGQRSAQESIFMMKAVKSFLLNHFSPDEPPNRPDWFEWQLANPRGSWFQVCQDREHIVGFSVTLPVRFSHVNYQFKASFATDTVVHPDYRGRGIGTRFIEVRVDAFDYAISSGRSPANERIYDKLHASQLDAAYNVMLVTQFPKPYFKRHYLRELWSWCRWKAHSWLRADDYRSEAGTELPANLDSFLDARFDPDSIGPVADSEFVRWRYEQHPYLVYSFVKVGRGNESLGIAVMRVADGHLLLVDLFCHHTNISEMLIALGKTLKAGKIRGVINGKSLARRFSCAGWLAYERGTFLLGLTGDMNLKSRLNGKSWCFYAGESDRDR